MTRYHSTFRERHDRDNEEFNRWFKVWVVVIVMMIISSCGFTGWALYTLINWVVEK